MKDTIRYHGIPIVGRMPLFTADNRQAIRDDRKTQTRRVIDPQPKLPFQFIGRNSEYIVAYFGEHEDGCILPDAIKCPYGKPGDVRCMTEPLVAGMDGMAYYRDDVSPCLDVPVISLITGKHLKWRWKRNQLSPIHMPTEAARTVCRTTDIRVEKLQEISEEDALIEGVITGSSSMGHKFTAKELFTALWDSINAKRGYGWDVPQWVWVDAFKKMEV